MSAEREDPMRPIVPGSPLAQALDGYAVPDLPAGFADRVRAAVESRPAPLPELRRSGGGWRSWRMGRRIAIGAVGFSALATAAAATGLFERLEIPVPSPQKVWATLTGREITPVPAAAVTPPVEPASAVGAPVVIEGPIDTPEELAEAFRRIDEVRRGRTETRRKVVDQRLDRALEQRRAAGLPMPTAEQEALLREQIEQRRENREALVEQRIEARRERLREQIENGGQLTRDDFFHGPGVGGAETPLRDRIDQFRQLPPDQRREALRRFREQRDRMLREPEALPDSAFEAPEMLDENAAPAPPADILLPQTEPEISLPGEG